MRNLPATLKNSLAPPKHKVLEKRIDAKIFEKISIFWGGRRKMKCRDSSETRFPKVSRLLEIDLVPDLVPLGSKAVKRNVVKSYYQQCTGDLLA